MVDQYSVGYFIEEAIRWSFILSTLTVVPIQIAKRSDKNKLYLFFKSCGLKNDVKQYPAVNEVKENEHGFTAKILMPAKLTVDDFWKHSQALSEYLNANVSFKYAGASTLIMSVIREKLPNRVPFKAIKYDETLKIAIGETVKGICYIYLSDKHPMLLIAGETGGGKSVCLRNIICQVILTKDPTKILLRLIDMKGGVEMGLFKKSLYVHDYVYDMEAVWKLLGDIEKEMYRRLKLFSDKGVVNITGYNELDDVEPLPSELIICDEIYTIMQKQHYVDRIEKLASMCRATGQHFVLCTQRPDADTLPGGVKQSFSLRICFKVADGTNSRIVIEKNGAEKLKGEGHGLLRVGEDLFEFKGMFIHEKNVHSLIKHTFVERKEAEEVKNEEAKGEIIVE